MKTCTKCNIEKPLSEYYKAKSNKDGLMTWCRTCETKRKITYYTENTDAVLATRKIYTSNKSRIKEITDKWYKNNKKTALATARAYQLRKSKAITPTTCLKTVKDIYAQCPKGWEVDHKIPVTKDGDHHQDNLCFITKELNCSKGNKLLSEHPELKKRFDAEVIYPKY